MKTIDQFSKTLLRSVKILQLDEPPIKNVLSEELSRVINIYIRSMYSYMDNIWQNIIQEDKAAFYEFPQNILSLKILSLFNLDLQIMKELPSSMVPNKAAYNVMNQKTCKICCKEVNEPGFSFGELYLRAFFTNKDCQCVQIPVVGFPINLETKMSHYVLNNYLIPLLRISGFEFEPEVKLPIIGKKFFRTDLGIWKNDSQQFFEYKLQRLDRFLHKKKALHSSVFTQVVACMIGMKTKNCFIITTSSIIKVKFREWELNSHGVKPAFAIETFNYDTGNISAFAYIFLKLQISEDILLKENDIERLKEVLIKGYARNLPNDDEEGPVEGSSNQGHN
ncbi:hypothetical protein CANMA_004373 [Candida margitis]|uniref:uncharacterized protein n=1 Tax=Candida margitis TaxID=1775924 RepID=UPI00222623EE|nr:uncharacterized protein CANMA_004373 [Candida margitis]KAI5957890.1 hypothetical protein CANMA_004373 [Candida margitis]